MYEQILALCGAVGDLFLVGVVVWLTLQLRASERRSYELSQQAFTVAMKASELSMIHARPSQTFAATRVPPTRPPTSEPDTDEESA